MGKNSTLLKSSHKNQNAEAKQVGVKESTINFLKQFARVYSYDSRLGCNLGGYVVN